MQSNERWKKIPVHLAEYDLFLALFKWTAEKPDQDRHWGISKFIGPSSVTCRLVWSVGDGRVAWLERAAASPEEAVSRALKDFTKEEYLGAENQIESATVTVGNADQVFPHLLPGS